jgi:hypothetical protein
MGRTAAVAAVWRALPIRLGTLQNRPRCRPGGVGYRPPSSNQHLLLTAHLLVLTIHLSASVFAS